MNEQVKIEGHMYLLNRVAFDHNIWAHPRFLNIVKTGPSIRRVKHVKLRLRNQDLLAITKTLGSKLGVGKVARLDLRK